MNKQSPSLLVVNILMWLIWSVILLGVSVLLAYAYLPAPDASKWLIGFEWVIALVLFLAIPLSIRFLLIPRIRNPWLLFLAFLIGIFFGDMTTIMGMFALLSGQQTYILAGVILLLLYCPFWIRPRATHSEVTLNREGPSAVEASGVG